MAGVINLSGFTEMRKTRVDMCLCHNTMQSFANQKHNTFKLHNASNVNTNRLEVETKIKSQIYYLMNLISYCKIVTC